MLLDSSKDAVVEPVPFAGDTMLRVVLSEPFPASAVLYADTTETEFPVTVPVWVVKLVSPLVLPAHVTRFDAPPVHGDAAYAGAAVAAATTGTVQAPAATIVRRGS